MNCRDCYWYEKCGERDETKRPCWAYYPARLEDMAEFELLADLTTRDEEPACGIGMLFEAEEE